MQLLLEQNQKHSRQLFLACLVIAVALSPILLRFVERSMSSLRPTHTTSQSAPDPNSQTWDPRYMWY